MTAEEKLNKIEEHIEKQLKNYKRLFKEDLEANRHVGLAMDREGMRELTKVKMMLKED